MTMTPMTIPSARETADTIIAVLATGSPCPDDDTEHDADDTQQGRIKAMAADTGLTPQEDTVPDSTVDGRRCSEDAPCHR
jgi:hypothetical protein